MTTSAPIPYTPKRPHPRKHALRRQMVEAGVLNPTEPVDEVSPTPHLARPVLRIDEAGRLEAARAMRSRDYIRHFLGNSWVESMNAAREQRRRNG